MEAPDGPDVIGQTETFVLVTLGDSVVDSEGRVTRPEVTTEVEGRVDELTARDVEIAAQVGQTHDIVCLAPADTVVSDRDVVRVTEPTRLAGDYKVDTIRTTRRHLRLLCSRTTVRE